MNKRMNYIDLAIQFQMEGDDVNVTAELKAEAERRLLEMVEAHVDLTGAEVFITTLEENPSHPYRFEVRVVLYAWPSDLVTVKKADTVQVALSRALDALERQVHRKPENYNEQWKRRHSHGRRAGELEDEGIFVGQIADARFDEEMLAEC